jgi:serine beta-lactamase-like protein LACTB
MAIIPAADMLKTHMKEFEIPGMQLAVALNGKLICSESFGFSDIENKIPVISTTSFRLASVSKSLTGAAIGLLMQEQKLNLDSPVDLYVPTFPKKRWPITIRQLTGHTSGIRHYNSKEEASNKKHYKSVTESLEQFSNDSLLFEPETQFEYSSFGYVLLSAVIESASHQSFPEFMNEKIFSPLGMNNTSMDFTDKDTPSRSKFYVIDEKDKRIEAPFVDNSNKWAAGGIISTAEDLVKFGNALIADSFLHPDIVNMLFTSMKTSDGKETGYGIGCEIRHDANDRKVISIDGSLPSTRAILLIYPKEKFIMALLANTGTSIFFNREEAFMLADLFLNPHGLNPTAQDRKSTTGKYTYSTFFDEDSIVGEINIFELDDKLQGTMTIPNRFFKNRIIPVPIVKVDGDEVSILGIPGNWVSLTFDKSMDAIRGKWRFGPLRGELHGRRKL